MNCEHKIGVQRENRKYGRGAIVLEDVIRPDGCSIGPRIQRDFQLLVVNSGEMKVRRDDEDILVLEGQGVLLIPGGHEQVDFSSTREVSYSSCAIRPFAVPAQLKETFHRFRGPIRLSERMRTLLHLNRRERNSSPQDDPMRATIDLSLGLALMCEFVSAVKGGQYTCSSSAAILTILEQFIRDKYSRDLNLNDLALAVGVSRQHLLRVCRALDRPTPMEQLFAKRVEMAAELLRKTQLPVNAVAKGCGFVSCFHFSRRFKEAYGECPTDWRRRYLQERLDGAVKRWIG